MKKRQPFLTARRGKLPHGVLLSQRAEDLVWNDVKPAERQKTVVFFECFPSYVCPEPVLVK